MSSLIYFNFWLPLKWSGYMIFAITVVWERKLKGYFHLKYSILLEVFNILRLFFFFVFSINETQVWFYIFALFLYSSNLPLLIQQSVCINRKQILAFHYFHSYSFFVVWDHFSSQLDNLAQTYYMFVHIFQEHTCFGQSSILFGGI